MPHGNAGGREADQRRACLPWETSGGYGDSIPIPSSSDKKLAGRGIMSPDLRRELIASQLPGHRLIPAAT